MKYMRVTLLGVFDHRKVAVFRKLHRPQSAPLAKSFAPASLEQGWQSFWADQLADARFNLVEQPRFTMCLPPPNVTGDLHLGHALTVTIQDAIARWHRMLGYDVVWVPGFDHAGIATQLVVTRRLSRAANSLSLTDSGKSDCVGGSYCEHSEPVLPNEFAAFPSNDEIISECHSWSRKRMEVIRKQLDRLGASLDWSRGYYTLDEKFSLAVSRAFVQLHSQGKIYRKKQFINWCVALQSSLSDFEVETKVISGPTLLNVAGCSKPVSFGLLHSVVFPFEDTNPFAEAGLVVATSRLESLPGDVAVAVHPEDERYAHLIGQFVTHPLNGRRMPVLADEAVEPGYGTGVLKITPAHDVKDYEVASRHGFCTDDCPLAFTPDGCMTDLVGEPSVSGMHRFQAREEILNILISKGLYKGSVPIDQVLPICYRSGDVIESLQKEQWFFDLSAASKRLDKALEAGTLKTYRPSWAAVWRDWLKIRREWCLSRQIVWGHPIPAYFISIEHGDIPKSGWFVAESEAEAKRLMKARFGVDEKEEPAMQIKQDEDVLDTWFSSALIPLVINGWPDVANPPPLSFMETGHDIIKFWVNAMALMGIDLTNCVPFPVLLCHGIIRDPEGRKMSKSLGNVISPDDVIEGRTLPELQQALEQSVDAAGSMDKASLKAAKRSLAVNYPDGIAECGVDALRFSLLLEDVQYETKEFSVNRVHDCRKFTNKIFHSYSFLEAAVGKWGLDLSRPYDNAENISNVDQWLFCELNATIAGVNQSFEQYKLHNVTFLIEKFWWHLFCDYYLEYSKSILAHSTAMPHIRAPSAEDIQRTLAVHCRIFDRILRLTCPIMPFICEDLYGRLEKLKGIDENDFNSLSVHNQSYPQPEPVPGLTASQSSDLVLACGRMAQSIVSSLRNVKSAMGMRNKDLFPSAFLTVASSSTGSKSELFTTLPGFDDMIKYMGGIASLKYLPYSEVHSLRSGLVPILIPKIAGKDSTDLHSCGLQLYLQKQAVDPVVLNSRFSSQLEKTRLKTAKLETFVDKLDRMTIGKRQKVTSDLTKSRAKVDWLEAQVTLLKQFHD